jgi:diguanylate cyclase (GGDEF)-like protein
VGLAITVPLAVGVVLIRLIPTLLFGYPLTLLPLLLAGPLAIVGLSTRRALGAALVAGLCSSLVVVPLLVFGQRVLGTGVWGLVSQSTMTPMPAWTPQIMLLPTTLVSSAQQDILFFQPGLALVLATLGLCLQGVGARLAPRLPSLLPRSLNARMQLTILALTALTVVVGWVGFSALEDMHFRGHQLQLQLRWQGLVGTAHSALQTEALARATGADPSASAADLERVLASLETTTSYAAVALGPDAVKAFYARYDDLVDAARAEVAAYHADPNLPLALNAASQALVALDRKVADDGRAVIDTDDAAHHARLFLMMIVVGLASGLGLWLGQRSVGTIIGPIRALAGHVAQVARGQFGERVHPSGPQELHRLAEDVNRMTADLDRLYAVERTLFQEQLWHQTFHDPLTGLPNRALMRDRLEVALARAERQAQPVGVLVLDLDNFKIINDSLGHQLGDELLRVVAERISKCLRAGDSAARMGGDEFTVLVEDLSDVSEVTAIAERVVLALRAPIALDGREVFVTASLGIALSSPPHTTADALLRNADLAMYRAKAGGKCRWEVYDVSLETRARERLDIEMDLRRALERDEFRVHYQPIINLGTGNVVEVEALVRWEHPERGRVMPDTFIPIAEETGLIVPLGQWVLEQSCLQARRWHEQFPHQARMVMSVNLSARQFQHPGLVADIERAVRESRLDPALLKLEITESVLMLDVDATVGILRALKALGIQLAIDDFGTGYSSLSYLKRFPIDTLKIDRSFVSGLGEDAQDTAIVRSVVDLAKTLHLSVTGEGIETAAQQRQLTELGCDQGQGFLFARPAEAAALDRMLRVSRTASRRAA